MDSLRELLDTSMMEKCPAETTMYNLIGISREAQEAWITAASELMKEYQVVLDANVQQISYKANGEYLLITPSMYEDLANLADKEFPELGIAQRTILWWVSMNCWVNFANNQAATYAYKQLIKDRTNGNNEQTLDTQGN